MDDVDAQTSKRRRGVCWHLPATLPLFPATLRLRRRRLRGLRKTHRGDLRCERDELVDEVLGAEVSVKLLVRAAGRPGALDEEHGEGVWDEGRCGTPDGDRLRCVHGEAVGGDVAEEEELLARGIVPHEERRGLVVADRVVLPVQERHRAHGHNVAEDGLVGVVELQPLGV